MPYTFDVPLVHEYAYIQIKSFTYTEATKEFTVVMNYYDADDFLMETSEATFSAADGAGNIIMPSDWPAEWPTGEQVYGWMKCALYGRFKEAKNIDNTGVLT